MASSWLLQALSFAATTWSSAWKREITGYVITFMRSCVDGWVGARKQAGRLHTIADVRLVSLCDSGRCLHAAILVMGSKTQGGVEAA